MYMCISYLYRHSWLYTLYIGKSNRFLIVILFLCIISLQSMFTEYNCCIPNLWLGRITGKRNAGFTRVVVVWNAFKLLLSSSSTQEKSLNYQIKVWMIYTRIFTSVWTESDLMINFDQKFSNALFTFEITSWFEKQRRMDTASPCVEVDTEERIS